ncbi:MAG: tetratricopeptide repeat protein [Candidatus Heimdallarchaeota archaeon]
MEKNEREKRAFLLEMTTDAQSFIRHGKKEKALECYEKILEKYPEETRAIYGKGMTHYEFDELQEAMKFFDQVLALKPNDIDSLYAKGSVLSNLGRNEEAFDLFNKILALDKKLSFVWLAKGYTLLDLEKSEQALDCFEKVSELGRSNDALTGKGHAYRKIEKFKEASKNYSEAIKLDPYDPEALFGLGVIEFENKNNKKALEYLYKCVVQDDDNADAWKVLAELYKILNQEDNVKIALDKIKELESS